MTRLTAVAIAGLVALGGTTLVPAPHAQAFTDDPIGEARKLAADLAARGRLTVAVDIAATTDARANGTAVFDFASDRCVVRINPSLLPGSPYRDGVGFRFFVYHELSHCELYRHPGGLFRFPEIDARQAALLDELVLFDTVDDPEERVNVFVLAHETYADLRAAALLIEEGVAPGAFAFMVRIRGEAPLDRLHDSSAALARIAAGRERIEPATLETRVRAMTGEAVFASAITPMFKGSRWQTFELWRLLENRARSVHGRMAAGASWWNDEIWLAPTSGSTTTGYPLLQWLMESEVRVRDGEARDTFVARWAESLATRERGIGADASDSHALADDAAQRLQPRMEALLEGAFARSR